MGLFLELSTGIPVLSTTEFITRGAQLSALLVGFLTAFPFPRRVFSISALVAVFFAGLIFLYPMNAGIAAAAFSWTTAATQLLIGLFLGLSIGVTGYAALLVAHWAANLIAPAAQFKSSSSCSPQLFSTSFFQSAPPAASDAVSLIFCYLLFKFLDFSKVFLALGSSLVSGAISADSPKASGLPVLFFSFLEISRQIFMQALLMSCPLFIAFLSLYLSYFVICRLTEKLRLRELFLSSQIPLLVFVLSLTLYALTDHLTGMLRDSTNDAQLKKMSGAIDDLR